jgi:hypothetical protein
MTTSGEIGKGVSIATKKIQQAFGQHQGLPESRILFLCICDAVGC